VSQRPGWLLAVLVVGAANLAPLGVWWWNRSADPVSTVEMSEREAGVRRGGDENTSVWLQLWRAESWDQRTDTAWADSASLAGVGFEAERLGTGAPVELRRRHPTRRPVWVLLRVGAGDGSTVGSRLDPVAIGPDPELLYRRAADRTDHLVLRGVVRVTREPLPVDSVTGVSPGETWSAALDMVTPGTMHVPRSLVPVLNGLAPDGQDIGESRYLVRVAMGRLHLPRVTGIFPANR